MEVFICIVHTHNTVFNLTMTDRKYKMIKSSNKMAVHAF